jgi:hypothetical protein
MSWSPRTLNGPRLGRWYHRLTLEVTGDLFIGLERYRHEDVAGHGYRIGVGFVVVYFEAVKLWLHWTRRAQRNAYAANHAPGLITEVEDHLRHSGGPDDQAVTT